MFLSRMVLHRVFRKSSNRTSRGVARWKLLLRRMIIAFLSLALKESLPPPTAWQAALVQELRNVLRGPLATPPPNAPRSEVVWINHMNRLQHLIHVRDPRAFLGWDVVTWTMFVTFAPYVRKELAFLKSLPTWDSRWRAAIRESSAGNPLPYLWYRESSGNLIHHAYHLAQFEEKTGMSINHLGYVVEFGGGYGSMCRLFHQLGFQGTYILFDLPPFSALQEFYLRSLNIPTRRTLHRGDPAGVICVSELDQVRAIMAENLTQRRALFLATFSLSEAPLPLRQALLPVLTRFHAFLILYNHKFEEVNNSEFFHAWRESFGVNMRWHEWGVAHPPGARYLIGVRLDSPVEETRVHARNPAVYVR